MTSTDYVIDGLTFGYRAGRVFDGLNARLHSGEVTAVVGGNGSGKSTLLNLVAGLLTPSAGRVSPRPSKPAMLAQRTEHIDSLPLTVRDCVRIGLFGHTPFWRPLSADDRRRADEMIERVGMTRFRHSPLRDLSGGQRQRAMIAQTMVQPADMYLLDEPSNTLDAAAKQILYGVLREKADNGCTVLMASHDHDEIRFADALIDLTDTPVLPD